MTIYNVSVNVVDTVYSVCVSDNVEMALDILEQCLLAPKSCMQILEYKIIYQSEK